MKEITYNKNYISLPVDILGLPKTVIINGTELQVKTSFHVSLLCVKNIISKYGEEIGDKVIELFKDFVANNRVEFQNYKGEYRFAERHDGRKTLVSMVNVSNLEDVFQKIRDELKIEFDSQPTHITLYTLELEEGIGINNSYDLDNLTKIVTEKVPDEVKDCLK